MAKKKNQKKNHKKNNRALKKKASMPDAKKPTESGSKKEKIELSKKIKLDHHHNAHSYAKALRSKYGKLTGKIRRPWKIAFKIAGAFVMIVALTLAAIIVIYGRDLPDVSKLKGMDFSETTTIYDREGNILYSVFDEENRKYVSLDEIAAYARNATIAIEDKSFYKHFGFDIAGIVRAQLRNISDKDTTQGASTITQQLAKNIFLSPEKTYERKIKELILSLEIEWMFSKDEILEMYLNKIPYGSNAFGIEAASHTFFGKPAKDLDLLQSAVMASLPKAPTYFSPYGQNVKELMGYCKLDQTAIEEPAPPDAVAEAETQDAPENSGEAVAVDDVPADGASETPISKCVSMYDENYVHGRKDAVLERMVEDKYITQAEADAAWKEGFTLQFNDPKHMIEAAHFVFYVKELLEQKYGKELVENGGLEVVTTLDPKLQSLGEEVIAKNAEVNLNKYRANNAALVAIDPKTGQVLAMVGSKNYWDSSINGQVNVTTSMRQPGSSFKPLVYAAAIENGKMGSGTYLGDYKTIFNKNYIPNNSDDTFKGQMTVRTALNWSRNIPAIKAFYIAGEEEKLLDFMDKIGVTSLRKFKNEFNEKADEHGWTFHYGPAMALGSGEEPLIETVGGYAVLANGGMRNPVTPILEVRDRHGNIIEKYENQPIQAVDPQAAFVINSMLSDSAAKPAGTWRSLLTISGHTVAAKTGTSNKKVGRVDYPNNLLTIGYTPSLALGVWVGNTDGSYLYRTAWGLYGAAPIWKEFMETVLKDAPDESFTEPEGIIHKGKEVYPSYYVAKNFDSAFRKVEEKKKDEKLPPPTDFVADKPANKKTPDASIVPEKKEPPSILKPSIKPVEYGF